jgi:hypothetical protein
MSELSHLKLRAATATMMEDEKMVREFKTSLKVLQSERPYFLPPVPDKETIKREPIKVSAFIPPLPPSLYLLLPLTPSS